jgi:hypothetical protein
MYGKYTAQITSKKKSQSQNDREFVIDISVPVIIDHGQDAEWWQEHGQTCTLCLMLCKTKKEYEYRHDDDPSPDTHTASYKACKQTSQTKPDQLLYIHGMYLKIKAQREVKYPRQYLHVFDSPGPVEAHKIAKKLGT